ncbi:glycosyltransferase family 4 protein [Anaerolinea thermophila]|uniref:Glycosyltransferase n=1 Tax=Anaerolinea thermophila (strain DSM 14523 / JCM 11388 / NBRC 100420 / UNI-1) TaxID=926569 RepID=E8N5A1_ANATU|nr:glycosyltransferase family 4 protein [Anaerolinea thermophila]BAJ63615.1 putative glycosyltransferase [Anaerolinea thermophila UNI-1]
MRILISLTYYRPHYSGLTIYTERLAKALVSRGHEVTVLTSRFHADLPTEEYRDGVRIVRSSVAFRLSKGVIMPSMPFKGWNLIRQADVINVHVPQMDAAYLAVMARILGKKVVMTYHCDLLLPRGFIHRMANWGSTLANEVSARASHLIVTNTQDYALHSAFLKRHLSKVRPVLPPIEMPVVQNGEIEQFRDKYRIKPEEKIIGISARMATEKGVEYLVQAMPMILERFPHARVLYNGQYENVLGEEEYFKRLMPQIQALGDRWTFLGIIPPVEQAAFFSVCDVTVLPSINSTESYGMVQVESMFCGTPVVASDLPGVRHAVQTSGMGTVVPPRNAKALAEAIIQILETPANYCGNIPEIKTRYASDTIASQYEAIFRELLEQGGSSK